jgi:hypothetical protein
LQTGSCPCRATAMSMAAGGCLALCPILLVWPTRTPSAKLFMLLLLFFFIIFKFISKSLGANNWRRWRRPGTI